MTQSFRIDLLVEPFPLLFNIFRIFCHTRAQIQTECRAQVTRGIFRGVAMEMRCPVTIEVISNQQQDWDTGWWAGASQCGWFHITSLGNRCALCFFHQGTKTVHPDLLPYPQAWSSPLLPAPLIVQKGLAGTKERGSLITVLSPMCEILKLIPKALLYQL